MDRLGSVFARFGLVTPLWQTLPGSVSDWFCGVRRQQCGPELDKLSGRFLSYFLLPRFFASSRKTA